MSILTHGRDMALAPTVTPIIKQSGKSLRSALDVLVTMGFGAVQIDATLSGIRPRELDKRGRKDLLAVLTRKGIRLGGLDLFIPRTHFHQDEHLDRAMGAVLAGIELAGDLGKVPVSIALPVQDMPDDLRSALVSAADGHGVRLAVHSEDQLDALLAWVEAVDLPALGWAIDPAAMIGRSLDAVGVIQKSGRRLAVARLSDMLQAQSLRCGVGEGDLDVVEYRVALDLAPHRTGPVVLDLRGMDNPIEVAATSKTAWENSAFTL